MMRQIELPHIVPEFSSPNCVACGLNYNSRLQIAGGGNKKILIIFDGQTPIQQTTKCLMTGEHYQYVRDILYGYGFTSDDIWYTTAIQCFVDVYEIKHASHCKPSLIQQLKTLQPRLVICFGEFSAKVLLSDIIEDGTDLDRVHGLLHHSRRFHCDMMFTYKPHPSNYKKESIEDFIIRRDIHIAIKSLSEPFKEWKDESQCVRILSPKEAARELENSIKNESKRVVALDYETNALKPYNSNSKIVSCAISEHEDDSYAFMVDDVTAPVLAKWWQTDHIRKIAHNSAFERAWTMEKLKVRPARLCIDTMLLMHVLYNRDRTFLSIKFLAPMLTGVALWNKHIESSLEPTKEDKAKYGEYALNAIMQLPQRSMLTYNAYDSLVEFRTFKLLWKWLNAYYESFQNFGEE